MGGLVLSERARVECDTRSAKRGTQGPGGQSSHQYLLLTTDEKRRSEQWRDLHVRFIPLERRITGEIGETGKEEKKRIEMNGTDLNLGRLAEFRRGSVSRTWTTGTNKGKKERKGRGTRIRNKDWIRGFRAGVKDFRAPGIRRGRLSRKPEENRHQKSRKPLIGAYAGKRLLQWQNPHQAANI